MITIRKFKAKDLKESADLVAKTFSEYNKKEGSKEAVKGYISRYSNLDSAKKSFSRSKIFFVAIANDKIVGIIRGSENRIINLYVRGDCHNKGIGRKLVERFEKECKKRGSKEIKIRASLFAAPFYQKMGYKKSTGIRKFIGLSIQPMKKKI